MVLTNFELWASDGTTATAMPLDFETNTHTRQLNPFDPRVIPQLNTNSNHLSSNGYYGFSYINAAHINDNNNNNDSNNNVSGTAYNLMPNDVNGINNTVTTTTTTAPQQTTHALSVNFGSSACPAGNAVNVARCKKRYFVINSDAASADCDAVGSNYEVSAKRCRFDDDFSAQYFNDFFQLPSTQIATQSCLMDIEEAPTQQQQLLLQQQQVDETMFENNNNIVKYEQNTNRQLENVQTLSAQKYQQHNQHSQQQQQLLQTQHTQPEQQQQNLYHHHQQHYQGHLHRANRDVSRCMLSHMI